MILRPVVKSLSILATCVLESLLSVTVFYFDDPHSARKAGMANAAGQVAFSAVTQAARYPAGKKGGPCRAVWLAGW